MKLILGLVFQIGGLGVSETRVMSINGHVSNLTLLPPVITYTYLSSIARRVFEKKSWASHS